MVEKILKGSLRKKATGGGLLILQHLAIGAEGRIGSRVKARRRDRFAAAQTNAVAFVPNPQQCFVDPRAFSDIPIRQTLEQRAAAFEGRLVDPLAIFSHGALFLADIIERLQDFAALSLQLGMKRLVFERVHSALPAAAIRTFDIPVQSSAAARFFYSCLRRNPDRLGFLRIVAPVRIVMVPCGASMVTRQPVIR
jgi:hypothetical protein